jgi:microcystin-dependent protein
MSCSNCFNGCTEIVSDRCVRYTGIDVPVLGIKNGDSLSFVEQALIEFLTSTLDGSGIKLDIDPTIICNLVKNYLPTCGDLTVVDFITALIKAACDLQTQMDAVVADIATIEAPYTIDCLTGVTSTSGTHAIVQAIITKLCTVETNLAALTLNVATNYVAVADINSYIAAYLASVPVGNRIKDKMVPYTVVEYYGSLGNFDNTGAGLDLTVSGGLDWTSVYLCNGLNGTPDKRGRVGVGAIQLVPGGTLDAAVNPLTPTIGAFNPNYAVYDKAGANSIILTPQQMPLHTHIANTSGSNITPNPHSHTSSVGTTQSSGSGPANARVGFDAATGSVTANVGNTTLTLTVDVINSSEGGDLPHDNKQPAIACYYIMYIP